MPIRYFGLKGKNKDHLVLEIIQDSNDIHVVIRYPSSNRRLCSAQVDRSDFLEVAEYIRNSRMEGVLNAD